MNKRTESEYKATINALQDRIEAADHNYKIMKRQLDVAENREKSYLEERAEKAQKVIDNLDHKETEIKNRLLTEMVDRLYQINITQAGGRPRQLESSRMDLSELTRNM